MARRKYLFLLLFAVALTAATRHFYVKSYRLEMGSREMAQGFELVQQRAGAYLELEEEGHAAASTSAKVAVPPDSDCGHNHDQQKHHHVTGMKLSNSEHVLKKPDEKVPDEMTEHVCQEPGCHVHGEHEHEGHEHEGHEHHGHANQDPTISPGLALLLRQLGFAELAANILWIQMDADSHRGLWHRVEVALEIIPALDPTFVDAYLLRSFLLDTYQGRHEEALQILENAVKQVPFRIELWQQIGLYCLNHSGRHGKARRLQRALEAFQEMTKFSDHPPISYRLIAVALAAMDRREEAIKVLQAISSDSGREIDQRRIDQEMMKRIESGEKF